jgi:hypothetical protein
MTSFAKFSLVFAVAVLAAVPSGSAQAGKQQPKDIVIPPMPSSCPLAMEARYPSGLAARVPVGSGGMVNAKPSRKIGQELHLKLTNSKREAVRAVRITAHGWTGKGRTLPAQKASSGRDGGSATVSIEVSIAPHATAERDVRLDGLTAVDSIDLVEVSYANGSSWEPASDDACHIVPDPVMLISQR